MLKGDCSFRGWVCWLPKVNIKSHHLPGHAYLASFMVQVTAVQKERRGAFKNSH